MHDDPAAKPSQKDRYRRFYLLVALVPILALAGVVAVNLPYLRLVPSNSLNTSRWKLGTREWMCFDFENERLFKTSEPNSPWESRDGVSVTIDNLGRLATISDKVTGQVAKSVPLPSVTGSLHVLDGRFILWCDQSKLTALDLTDEEPRVFLLKRLTAKFSTQGIQLIAGTSRFLLDNAASGPISEDMAELFEIRDHQIVMLQTWPISAEVTVKQDQLFSFSADGLHVECRSASDGKLIETYSVPATHERLTGYTTMQNLFGSILAVYSTNFDQITFYDLKRQKYLDLDVEHSKPVYGDSSRNWRGRLFCSAAIQRQVPVLCFLGLAENDRGIGSAKFDQLDRILFLFITKQNRLSIRNRRLPGCRKHSVSLAACFVLLGLFSLVSPARIPFPGDAFFFDDRRP